MSELCYCYAAVRPFPPAALDGMTGVRGAAVQLVADGELAVLVSQVPADEFDENALRANLEQLSWLEEVARAHNTVVDAAAQHGPALPFRLATIYLDADRVRAMLRNRGSELSAALDRVRNRVEWGVKVYAQPHHEGMESRAAAMQTGELSGRAYLRRRMAERHAGERAWDAASIAAEQLDEALTTLAEDRREHRLQSGELSSAGPGQNVLNVAYLVAAEDSSAFLALVTDHRARTPECHIEVTGPWVPYSFTVEQT